MSNYKERKNKKNIQLEDELISDWKYFTGQQNYWGVAKKHNKNIKIPKVKVLLKNVSSSSEYKQYIKEIACPFSITRCKNCMGCFRVKPCLWCYTCKHWNPQFCSRLMCFTNPNKDDPFFNSPLGEWSQNL